MQSLRLRAQVPGDETVEEELVGLQFVETIREVMCGGTTRADS